MLTESQVIAAVCRFLEKNDFRVTQRLSETQHGRDIVAISRSGKPEITIEAKGETSSMAHTRRYGKPFSSGQVTDHVAKALYCAARDTSPDMLAGVAFPKNTAHIECVRKILPALKKLRIEVFWVRSDESVEVARVWKTWGTARMRQSPPKRGDQ
jgi:hypothetical protein